jgi:hypothetical protein
LALKQFYIKNVGPAKIQRVQQKIPGPMSSKMKTNFKKSVNLWVDSNENYVSLKSIHKSRRDSG